MRSMVEGRATMIRSPALVLSRTEFHAEFAEERKVRRLSIRFPNRQTNQAISEEFQGPNCLLH
jgi:hypothetical protein